MDNRALSLVVLETVATTTTAYLLVGLDLVTLFVGLIGLVVIGATVINGKGFGRGGGH